MTPKEAANKVRKGQGPKGIDRIDRPKIKGEQWHAHIGPGAINIDGSWKHKNGITKKQKDFLRKVGWNV